MAGKITDLTAIGYDLSASDIFEILDVSDTSLASTGTNKSISILDLSAYISAVSLVGRHVEVYTPTSPQQTTMTSIGAVTPTVTGSATARTLATTNMFTRTTRVGYVSATGGGESCGIRSSAQTFTMGVPGSPNIGGFRYISRFGSADAAAVTNARQFVGISSGAGALGGGFSPSTLTNCIGMGHGNLDANMSIYYGGSSAQTPIGLGSNFPANTRSVDMYQLELVNLSSSNNTVYYRVTRLNTGDIATGTLTGTAGTALPANTTFLNAAYAFRDNGASSAAVSLDIAGIALQSGF